MFDLNRDSVIGENAFTIDGVISIAKGEDQEAFIDELVKYLQSKGAYFFGCTETIEGEAMREGRLREIFSMHINSDVQEEE